MVEQLTIVVQADAAVEKIATTGDARRVNVADWPDHEVERQFELGAELRQHPEHRRANLLVLVGAQIQFLDRAANRRDSPPGSSATRDEVRRQADRAGPGTPACETLEDPADRLAQAREILDIDPRGPPQPINGVRLMKLENQVVGPQAGHIRGGIPALERVIEVVGQENRLQPRGLPDLPIPLLTIAIAERTVVKLADRLGIDPVVGETVEGPGNLQQPGVLDRVIDALEILGQVRATVVRGSRPGSTRSAGIPVAWASSV